MATLPALDPDHALKFTAEQRVQASVELRIDELVALHQQHTDRIAADEEVIARTRRQLAHVAEELAAYERLAAWLASAPAASACSLCRGEGCEHLCGPA